MNREVHHCLVAEATTSAERQSISNSETSTEGFFTADLTKVFERMNGRKNLASWLMAPATPTMRPLFANNAMTNDEIVQLVKDGVAETSGTLPELVEMMNSLRAWLRFNHFPPLNRSVKTRA